MLKFVRLAVLVHYEYIEIRSYTKAEIFRDYNKTVDQHAW